MSLQIGVLQKQAGVSISAGNATPSVSSGVHESELAALQRQIETLQRRGAIFESVAARELEDLKTELKKLTVDAVVDAKRQAAFVSRSPSRNRQNSFSLEDKVATMSLQIGVLQKQAGASISAGNATPSVSREVHEALGS